MCLLFANRFVIGPACSNRGGGSGGPVQRETTSRGLCNLVCPSRTSERGGEGYCVRGGGGVVCVYYCSTDKYLFQSVWLLYFVWSFVREFQFVTILLFMQKEVESCQHWQQIEQARAPSGGRHWGCDQGNASRGVNLVTVTSCSVPAPGVPATRGRCDEYRVYSGLPGPCVLRVARSCAHLKACARVTRSCFRIGTKGPGLPSLL